MKPFIYKTAAAAAFLAAAMASQAFSFATFNQGNFSLSNNATSGTTTFNGSFAIAPGSLGYPLFNFTSGTLTYTYAGVPNISASPVSGEITLYGPNSADSMTFDFTGSIFGVTNAQNLGGGATLVGSTGLYSGYTQGVGSISNGAFILGNDKAGNPTGSFQGNFEADVQAVPEPAGIAAIIVGIGALALRRRAA